METDIEGDPHQGTYNSVRIARPKNYYSPSEQLEIPLVDPFADVHIGYQKNLPHSPERIDELLSTTRHLEPKPMPQMKSTNLPRQASTLEPIDWDPTYYNSAGPSCITRTRPSGSSQKATVASKLSSTHSSRDLNLVSSAVDAHLKDEERVKEPRLVEKQPAIGEEDESRETTGMPEPCSYDLQGLEERGKSAQTSRGNRRMRNILVPSITLEKASDSEDVRSIQIDRNMLVSSESLKENTGSQPIKRTHAMREGIKEVTQRQPSYVVLSSHSPVDRFCRGGSEGEQVQRNFRGCTSMVDPKQLENRRVGDEAHISNRNCSRRGRRNNTPDQSHSLAPSYGTWPRISSKTGPSLPERGPARRTMNNRMANQTSPSVNFTRHQRPSPPIRVPLLPVALKQYEDNRSQKRTIPTTVKKSLTPQRPRKMDISLPVEKSFRHVDGCNGVSPDGGGEAPFRTENINRAGSGNLRATKSISALGGLFKGKGKEVRLEPKGIPSGSLTGPSGFLEKLKRKKSEYFMSQTTSATATPPIKDRDSIKDPLQTRSSLSPMQPQPRSPAAQPLDSGSDTDKVFRGETERSSSGQTRRFDGAREKKPENGQASRSTRSPQTNGISSIIDDTEYTNKFMECLFTDEDLPGSENLFKLANLLKLMKIHTNLAQNAADQARAHNAEVKKIRAEVLRLVDQWREGMNGAVMPADGRL